jgi:predicted nuclease with TOPRIM domain
VTTEDDRYQLNRLRARLTESEAENDQWQKKLAETWAELERLRSEVERLTFEAMRWAEENERLRNETGRG